MRTVELLAGTPGNLRRRGGPEDDSTLAKRTPMRNPLVSKRSLDPVRPVGVRPRANLLLQREPRGGGYARNSFPASLPASPPVPCSAFPARPCFGVLAPARGVLVEGVARTLGGAAGRIKVVGTVGIILIAGCLGSRWCAPSPPAFPGFLPRSAVQMLGVNVTWAQIILFLFS